jgi:hypothetical protein
MYHGWKTTKLESESEVLQKLSELRGKRWLCRGLSRHYGGLIPSIDRLKKFQMLSRSKKLDFERRSFILFQTTARYFADEGERGALSNDIIALMVLRHYGVPTRLMDWSASPWVATYFATEGDDKEDGEIWAINEPLYEIKGKEQWKKHLGTTTDGSGDDDKFDPNLTAFALNPPDWFICLFYPRGFTRQIAQQGAYSFTPQFGKDHADAIASLLSDPNQHHVYIISKSLKPALQRTLHKSYNIWHGSLFPDSSGAAETAKTVFNKIIK